jgi:hypothetical protein
MPAIDVKPHVVGALLYALLGLGWIFGICDTGALNGHDVLQWTPLAVLALAHVAFGFALSSWIVLAFPSLLLLLAVAAGYPNTPYESPPLWFWQGLLSPFLLVLLALGVTLRRTSDRLRRASARWS